MKQNRKISRRQFLTMASGFLAGAYMPIPAFTFKERKGIHLNELYIGEISWDLKNDCFFQHELKIGDKIPIALDVDFDHFEETKDRELYIKQVVNNIYEFTFRPIKRYYSGPQHKNCYHYLINPTTKDMLIY